MKVLISDITSAIAKVSELASDNTKQVPGVLFIISENKLGIAYTDGRKAVIEYIEAETDDTDPIGQTVFDYTRLVGAINNCQPSGRIVVDDIVFRFESNDVVILEAEQKCLTDDGNGNEEYVTLAVKQMKLTRFDVKSSLRTAILGRMDYDKIFEQTMTDEWTVSEFVDILSRMSVEKSRVVYMSPNIQKVFVSNSAYVTAAPVSKIDVTPLEYEELRRNLEAEGKASEYEDRANELSRRLNFPATIATNTAKQVCGILGKLSQDEKLFTCTDSGYMRIFTDNDKIGIWLEMTDGSKAQTSQFERFASIEYDTYQLNFVREFLADAMKSAMAASSSEKMDIMFEENNGCVELKVNASNTNASVNDTYHVKADGCIETQGNITNLKLSVSSKVINSMLAQLKTDMIAVDISILVDGSPCIRLAELDMDKVRDKYYSTRSRLGLTDIDPTPDEEKIKYRTETLGVAQYTMLSK